MRLKSDLFGCTERKIFQEEEFCFSVSSVYLHGSLVYTEVRVLQL